MNVRDERECACGSHKRLHYVMTTRTSTAWMCERCLDGYRSRWFGLGERS
jgi:hypothetical protein